MIWRMAIQGCFITLFFLAVSSPVIAQEQKGPAVVLTLDEAIVIALRDNRDIRLNQEKLAQAKLKIEEAKGAFLPEVTLTGGAIDTRGLYKKDINNYSFQGNVKQYIYKGGKSLNTLKQARHKKDVQEALLEKNVSDSAANIKKAFYTILMAKEFIQVNRLIRDNSRAHFDSLQERYARGEVAESDLLRAKARLADSRSLYESALNQEENAREVFKNILSLEEKTDVELQGGFEYAPKAIAIDRAILEALELRPEIRQFAAQSMADQADVEISKSANRPSVYGSFDYYSRSTTSLSFSPGKGWQDYNVIGFTLSWPVFDGFITSRKVEEAISTLKQDTILEGKLKADIAGQVKEAYLALKTGIAKLEPKERDIEVYQDNLKVIQSKYNDGLSSALDLSDAGLALALSDFNQKQAVYDCLIAKARLDNAMGVIAK